MQRRRRWLPIMLLGISLLLLLVALAIIVVPQLTSPSSSVHPTPTVVTTHLLAADVSRLEKALNSPDMHIQATVMTPDLASVFLAQGKPAYPVGSTVKVLQDTSRCRGDICDVTSVVTEPGGKKLTFLLHLTNLTGTWLIFSTTQEI